MPIQRIPRIKLLLEVNLSEIYLKFQELERNTPANDSSYPTVFQAKENIQNICSIINTEKGK
jgi:hypothetical protein